MLTTERDTAKRAALRDLVAGAAAGEPEKPVRKTNKRRPRAEKSNTMTDQIKTAQGNTTNIIDGGNVKNIPKKVTVERQRRVAVCGRTTAERNHRVGIAHGARRT